MFCNKNTLAIILLSVVGLATLTGCPASTDPNYEWTLNEGDLVVHATNDNIVMVISHRSSAYSGVYYCTWVDESGDHHQADFRQGELRLAPRHED